MFSPGGQPPNGQTVGDLVSSPPVTNGLPPSHGTPAGGTHHISTLGAHQIRMMPLPPGMQFRPHLVIHMHPVDRNSFLVDLLRECMVIGKTIFVIYKQNLRGI